MWLKENLRTLRRQHGMTQQELAEKLDVSRQAISSWERGTAEPSTENLVALGKLFDVSLDVLLGGNEQPQAEPAEQPQAEPAVKEVVAAEEKGTPKKYSIYNLLAISGITFFATALLFMLIVYSNSKKEPQWPIPTTIPMEELKKEEVNVSEAIVLPLEPLD